MATQSGALDARLIHDYAESLDDPRPSRPRLWDVGGWARRPSVHMRRRLSTAISELQDRLDARTGLIDDGTRAVDLMLHRARQYLLDDRILEGWQEIFDARLALVNLYTPETLAAQRLALREEARDALSKGRLRAIESLLGTGEPRPPGGPPDSTLPRERAELQTARGIIDGHYQGIHMRAAHARTQLFFLPFVLALILGALLAVSLTVDPVMLGTRESLMSQPGLLVWTFALGGLGALLSVALGAIRGVTKHNYRLLTELRTNVTRLLLGAASAAAVVAVLETELLNMGEDGSDSGLILAVAIAAGFSERLLTNAIAAVVPANGAN